MKTSRRDSNLAFPKRHEPSRRERWNAHYRRWRPIVRAEAYERDGGRCRACQCLLDLNSDNPWRHANINENPPRSLGGNPTNRRQVLTLCKRCHSLFSEGQLNYVPACQPLGTDGPVIFEGKLAVPYVSHPIVRDFKGVSDDHAFEG